MPDLFEHHEDHSDEGRYEEELWHDPDCEVEGCVDGYIDYGSHWEHCPNKGWTERW